MNKMMIAGAICAGFLAAAAICAPVLTRYDYKAQNTAERLQPPSAAHIFGTDELGRDLFSRMIYGARVSIMVGVSAVLISTLIGILIGSIAGYFGGITDSIAMRFVDIMLTIPSLFLILMLVVFLGPSIINIMIIIGLTSWTDIARIIRAEVMSIKKSAYIDAARLIGLGRASIIIKHILPNTMGPVFVYMTFGISGAILTESGLSFLGLGVQPPYPSWGNILTAGKDYIETAWWLILFPGMAIFLAVFSCNILGEGLRDMFNPRLKKQ
ncbi:MAG: ABC transporter permease [Candidatus Goldiibacteriota bacterium]|jgi:peptide/nickel transport system permease protein